MTLQVWIDLVLLPVLGLSLLLTFCRFVVGPQLPDRVLALDLMIMLGIGLIALRAISSGETIFIDVALVFAVISFLSTIGFSYYLLKEKDL